MEESQNMCERAIWLVHPRREVHLSFRISKIRVPLPLCSFEGPSLYRAKQLPWCLPVGECFRFLPIRQMEMSVEPWPTFPFPEEELGVHFIMTSSRVAFWENPDYWKWTAVSIFFLLTSTENNVLFKKSNRWACLYLPFFRECMVVFNTST